jgi:hypothetical protein
MQQETSQYWASSNTKSLPTMTVVETLDPFPKQIFNINNSSSAFLPLTTMPTARDRTSEFQTTVKKFASKRVRKKSMELKDLFIGILEWS